MLGASVRYNYGTLLSISSTDILASMHHARHLASSEELLDSYDCRIKAILALWFRLQAVYYICRLQRDLKGIYQLLPVKK